VMILFDITWPFEIAAVILALSALEEIAITMTLPEWQSNVPSVWHARKFARTSRVPQ